MNEEFEDVRRLLALKRYEQPPAGYVDDVVREFRFRVHEDEQKKAAKGRFGRFFESWFSRMSAPTWGLAGATAVALLAAVTMLRPAIDNGNPSSSGMQPVNIQEPDRRFVTNPVIFGEEESKPADEESKKAQPPTKEEPSSK
jgi:hypothetical protein